MILTNPTERLILKWREDPGATYLETDYGRTLIISLEYSHWLRRPERSTGCKSNLCWTARRVPSCLLERQRPNWLSPFWFSRLQLYW